MFLLLCYVSILFILYLVPDWLRLQVRLQVRHCTVLESSLPDSMMRRHRGIISVVSRKLITSCSSVFTRAPKHAQTVMMHTGTTFDDVTMPHRERALTYDPQAGEAQVLEGPGLTHCVQERVEEERDVSSQEGRPEDARTAGSTSAQPLHTCDARARAHLVSGWEATHCSSARALQTLLDWCAVRVGGLMDG